jgi:carboxyl-terminal processing protease
MFFMRKFIVLGFSFFILSLFQGCLLAPDAPGEAGFSITSKTQDTLMATGQILQITVMVNDTSALDKYYWDFDGNNQWDDSTKSSTVGLIWPDSGEYAVHIAARNKNGSFSATVTVQVQVVKNPIAYLRDFEFQACWQYLQSFFIFQKYLPSNPLSYVTPKTLYQSVSEPYTLYYNSSEAAGFLSQLTTRSAAGVGIIIDSTQSGYAVKRVIKNSPGEKAGILKGDTIYMINGTSVAGVTYQTFRSQIMGNAGDTRELGLRRAGTTLTITVTLGSFLSPSVFTDSIDSTISYIALTLFSDSTSDSGGTSAELKVALDETAWSAYTILDLRGNGGGLINQCVDVSSQFLPESTGMAQFMQRDIDTTTGTASTIKKTYKTGAAGSARNRKMIILADEYTASASELFITALKSNRSIKIAGKTTYGKARGQVILGTPSNGLAKITYALITPLTGASYDLIGIEPDYASDDALQKATDLAHEWLNSPSPKTNRPLAGSLRKIEMLREQIKRPWNGGLCITF